MSASQNGTAPASSGMMSISILDLFLPGSTGVLAIFEQLLAGKSTSLARMLSVLGILLYFAKRISANICALIEGHLG